MRNHRSITPGFIFDFSGPSSGGGGSFLLPATLTLARIEACGLVMELLLVWDGEEGQVLRFPCVREDIMQTNRKEAKRGKKQRQKRTPSTGSQTERKKEGSRMPVGERIEERETHTDQGNSYEMTR